VNIKSAIEQLEEYFITADMLYDIAFSAMKDIAAMHQGMYKAEKVDDWSLELPGDCENIALNRYFEAKKRGFDPKHMWIAIVDVVGGPTQHAVLVIRLPDGHWVLDNRNIVPVRWNDPVSGYFKWRWMWPVETGKGWIIHDFETERPDIIPTGKRQNVNPPEQLIEFRRTI